MSSTVWARVMKYYTQIYLGLGSVRACVRVCVRACVPNHISETNSPIILKLGSMTGHYRGHMHVISFDRQIQDGRLAAILNFFLLNSIVYDRVYMSDTV